MANGFSAGDIITAAFMNATIMSERTMTARANGASFNVCVAGAGHYGRVEIFDSLGGWANVRLTGATFTILTGSTADYVTGSPASGEVQLTIAGGFLVATLGSAAARSMLKVGPSGS